MFFLGFTGFFQVFSSFFSRFCWLHLLNIQIPLAEQENFNIVHFKTVLLFHIFLNDLCYFLCDYFFRQKFRSPFSTFFRCQLIFSGFYLDFERTAPFSLTFSVHSLHRLLMGPVLFDVFHCVFMSSFISTKCSQSFAD